MLKSTWLVNGKIQLVLTPTNEREKSLLEELTKGPVEITMHDRLQIGQEAAADSLVISTKAIN